MTWLHGRWARLQAARPGRVRLVVWAVLAVPFVIAAAVLATRDWNPVLDLAMTELRVRDVGGRHTPLIGLPGRIGVFPDQGSHPGPLSFYLLAPVYRVAGSGAWGLLAATVVLALVAVGVALWLAERRGGMPLALVIGALLVVLVRGYGLEVLTQPWNPYLPLLFWLVVLLATWSVLDGDLAMIVVVAAAGSLCAQTHLPYLGLTLGMVALCAVAMLATWVRHPVQRRVVLMHGVRAVAVAFVLWMPVLVDEVRHSPGNLSMLSDYFRHPPEDPVGTAEGVRLLLRHLDPVRLARAVLGSDGAITRAGYDLDGSILPGLGALAVWLVAAVWAWRHGHRLLRTLHVVVGWSLLLGAVSMSRIFGKVWYYLTLWAWTSAALLAVSLAWTAAALLRTRVRPTGTRVRGVLVPVAAVAVVVSYAALVVEAFGTHAPEQHLSDTLAELVAPTAEALEAGTGGAAGAAGTYLVTWFDANNFGSQGYGLLNELERRGLDVGVLPDWRVPATAHRVLDPSEVTAEVVLATGSYVDGVAAADGAVEVARHDPRDAAELAEYQALEAELIALLRDAGLDDLVPRVTTDLFGVQVDPRVSTEVQSRVDRMLRLGTTTAVFVFPRGQGG